MIRLTILGTAIAFTVLLLADCRRDGTEESGQCAGGRTERLEADVKRLEQQCQALTEVRQASEDDRNSAVAELAKLRAAHEDCGRRLSALQAERDTLLKENHVIMESQGTRPSADAIQVTLRMLQSLRAKVPERLVSPKEDKEYQQLLELLRSYYQGI